MAQNQDRPMRKKVADFFRQAPRRYPVFSVALGIIILVLIIWFIPQWQVPVSGLSFKDRLHQINENRKTVAQIVGGVFLLVGLYIAWVRSEAAKKMAEVNREQQLTDLYVKAIEQLGSEKLQIRLGGIYALERIARESAKDHWPIMEVLTAFVRENAPCTGPPPLAEIPPTDLQAVLTVLGRTAIAYAKKGETQSLNLLGTHLAGAYLMQANLQAAVLVGANLQAAALGEANFQGANLFQTNLQGAVLWAANLQGAGLQEANLQASFLVEANLQGTVLDAANLQGANLFRTNLQGADLRGAKGLTSEQVAEAIWDETTRWPEGFSPPPPTESKEEKRT